MIETLKNLTKHTVIYGLGSLLSKLLAFVLLPIYTRYLTPADYGILSLLGITAGIATTIAQLGLGTAMFREILYQKSEPSSVESTTLYFLLGESILFSGILVLFSSQLSMLMFHTTGQTHLLSLAFLTGLLGMFEAVMLAKIRIRNQSARYAALSVAKFLLGALLNIYYIVVLRRGVEGLIIAGFILEALFASVYFFLLLPGLKFVFSLPVLKRMLKFGIPMVPSGVSSLLLVSVDRYFLQYFSTTAEVGLYSLGYNIGMVINLIVQALQLSWPAQMFASAKQPDAEHQFSKMLTYYLVVLGFAGLGLSVLTRGLLAIMTTSQFYEASKVVPLIVLSYILNGARMMTNTALTTQNRMKYIPPIVIASAVFNLGLNYLLIPRYGMMGAAWATVIAYLFLVVVQTAVNQHFWHIPYEYQRIVKIVLVWAIIYGSSFLTLTPSMWINICLKLILLAMYPLLLYGLGFYEEQELTALKGLYQSGMQYFRAWRMES